MDTAYVGGQECNPALWVSNAELRCLAVRGDSWEGSNVEVNVRQQKSPRNRLFAHIGQPVVQSVTPPNGVGGNRIIIAGENFGRQTADIDKVMLGQHHCDGVVLRGPTSIECFVPELEDINAPAMPVVVHQRGGAISTGEVSFTYGVLGIVWPFVASRVQAWRERNDRIEVRWAFPFPTGELALELGAEPLQGFEIETRLLPAGTASSNNAASASASAGNVSEIQTTVFDVDLEDIQYRNSSTDALALMRASVTAVDPRPLQLRIRALNAAGGGPATSWSPLIPSTCAPTEFLSTYLDPSEWVCRSCGVTAATCDGGSSFSVAARSGYQRLPWVAGRAAFIRCPRPESCLVGTESAADSEANSVVSNNEGEPSMADGGSDTSSLPTLQQLYQLELPPSSIALEQAGAIRRAYTNVTGGNTAVLLEGTDSPTGPASHHLSAMLPPWMQETCAEGYSGIMCARCEPGHTPWGSYECQKCRGGVAVAVVAVLLIMVIVMITIALVLNALRRGAQAAERLQQMERGETEREDRWGNVVTIDSRDGTGRMHVAAASAGAAASVGVGSAGHPASTVPVPGFVGHPESNRLGGRVTLNPLSLAQAGTAHKRQDVSVVPSAAAVDPSPDSRNPSSSRLPSQTPQQPGTVNRMDQPTGPHASQS